MAGEHLHALRGASLRGEVQRRPPLVVPHVEIHQGFGKCLQGFTVTVIGLRTEQTAVSAVWRACTQRSSPTGTIPAPGSLLLLPRKAPAHAQTREVAPSSSTERAPGFQHTNRRDCGESGSPGAGACPAQHRQPQGTPPTARTRSQAPAAALGPGQPYSQLSAKG